MERLHILRLDLSRVILIFDKTRGVIPFYKFTILQSPQTAHTCTKNTFSLN